MSTIGFNMTFFTNNLVYDIVAVFALVLIAVSTYFKWHLSYWNRLGVPSLKPVLFFGDTKNLFLSKCTIGEQFREFYNNFKSKGYKHGGIFFGPKPFYIPIDLEIIKHILQKDFQHFMDHGFYINEEDDPLSAHLLNLEDIKWKNMRAKLTPTFTSGKMKIMFQTLSDCTIGLIKVMNDSAIKHTSVDIKDVFGRFTTDIIASVAFGLECNSLENPDAEFRRYGRRVFEIGFFDRIKTLLTFAIPHPVLRFFRFKFNKSDVEFFFIKAISETVNYREANNIYRKDFMHLLLQLKNHGSVTDDENITSDKDNETKALTLNELAAQAFVFFLAGFETSSTAMTWALYELAMNQEIQQKLRHEINDVLNKHNNKLTYEAMMDMPYMEKVIHETLRKYPPIPVLTRKCTKDYTIPNTSIQLNRGVSVSIPVLALHNDPEYYPNPEKFDPDRFSEDNVKARHGFTWLPFGEGPRICIGLRFGLLQSKVGLTAILKHYEIKLSNKTKLPVILNPRSFITSAKDSIWLDVKKID
ncbi:cytochrome P450 6A1-like [Tribolium madens]|uniref:cytochrome P450 6A1-like n=1 Tax=Tribolium madens TaxID=41895 RepID=UPI001CF723CD|nr:cytochrome P450 6A1-like [Tribolium madens]